MEVVVDVRNAAGVRLWRPALGEETMDPMDRPEYPDHGDPAALQALFTLKRAAMDWIGVRSAEIERADDQARPTP